MPRPKLASDADVLDATRRVILRVGAEKFTLTDVAEEVGLSRAALIQRFENRAGLERRLASHNLDALQRLIDGSPIANKGPSHALAFLQGVLDGFDIGLLVADAGANEVLRDAIMARLDEPSRQRGGEVADTLMTVMQGAAMQGDRRHIGARLLLALRLIYAGPAGLA